MFRFVGCAAFCAGVVEAAETQAAKSRSTRNECLFTFSGRPGTTDAATMTVPVGSGGCQPDGNGHYFAWQPFPRDCFEMDWFDEVGGCPSVSECGLEVEQYTDDQCTLYEGSERCKVVTDKVFSEQPTGDRCTGVLTTGSECAESLFHAGWDCFDDVLFAKKTGIYQHPEWYGSLTASSTIEEFHSYISALPICSPEQPPPCAAHSCASPCYLHAQKYGPDDMERVSFSTGFWQITDVCVADGNGGSNFVAVNHFHYDNKLLSEAVVWHYPDPFCHTSWSRFTREGVWMWRVTHGQTEVGGCCNVDTSTCGLDCTASIATCHRLSPESECATQLRWAMTEGIHQHPEWYPGLSVDSSLLDFQFYLSGLPRCSENGSLPPCYGGSDSCPIPCTKNRVSSRDAGDIVV